MKTRPKVFLIDDDTEDQEIFSMAFQKVDPDIQVEIANDGIEGIEKLRADLSFIPNYIFIDINMPKMNGVDCLPEIKKLKHLENARIFMFSTSAEPKVIAKSRELGADDLVLKPPSLKGLIETLTKILEDNIKDDQK